MDHIESILDSLPMILDSKNEGKTLKTTKDIFFPDEKQDYNDSFEKLFKIAFDNCESKERAKELMKSFVNTLNIVTFDEINVIIWLSNDCSIGQIIIFLIYFLSSNLLKYSLFKKANFLATIMNNKKLLN
jgi:hypothetical protein